MVLKIKIFINIRDAIEYLLISVLILFVLLINLKNKNNEIEHFSMVILTYVMKEIANVLNLKEHLMEHVPMKMYHIPDVPHYDQKIPYRSAKII